MTVALQVVRKCTLLLLCTSQVFAGRTVQQLEAQLAVAEARVAAAEAGQAYPPAIQHTDRGLLATVQIATLDEHNAIEIPNSTQHVFIEVGCSDLETLDHQLLPKDPSAFLLSFEPLLDKYSILAARGNRQYNGHRVNMAVPLGHHHRRGVVLPLAVAPSVPASGMLPFNVHKMAGCSSLLKSTTTAGWAPWCKDGLEKRLVPAITMSDAITMAGEQRPIKLLKLDAQGVDLKLIQSTPASRLQRVQAISMELHKDTPWCSSAGMLYKDRELCPEAVRYMASIGFRYVGFSGTITRENRTLGLGKYEKKLLSPNECPTDDGHFCELQALFVNDRGLHPPLLGGELERIALAL